MAVVLQAPVTAVGQTFHLTLLAPTSKHWGSVVETLVTVSDSPETAAAAVTGIIDTAKTHAGRAGLGRIFAAEAAALTSSASFRARFGIAGEVGPMTVNVGLSASPAANIVELPITVKSRSASFRMVIAYLQVDRTLSIVALVRFGSKTLGVGALRPLWSAQQDRIRAAFTVANTALPTIGGTVAQGRPLTADAGSWQGVPSSFAYAWQRCDTTGNGCSPIAGAVTETYTPIAADSGSTLRVAVTGANTVNSQQAMSATPSVVP